MGSKDDRNTTVRSTSPQSAEIGSERLTRSDIAILAACLVLGAAFMVPVGHTADPLPDFRAFEPQERKARFFEYLQPFVAEVNAGVAAARTFVLSVRSAVAAGRRLTWYQRSRVERLAKRYEIDTADTDITGVIGKLAHRIGTVPESLVLVQAAKESGWGTSRFAIEGNNLFGQRCYESGCGIKPKDRPADVRFGVAKYGSVRESLESYVRNLNTHPEYEEFRERRAELRARGEPVTGTTLAAELDAYSERGQAYIDEIRAMIRQNGLE